MSHETHRTLSGRVGRLLRRFSLNSGHNDRAVAVGERFFCVSHTAPVWIVRKVFTPFGHKHPHAVLERVDQPSDQNLIAIERLLDEDTFRPDRRSRLSTSTTLRIRRRRDDPKQLFFR